MAGPETLVGSSPRTLRRRMGCSATAARSTPAMRRRFAGGGALEVGTVIWATALRTDHARIDVPVRDNRGRPIHQRGVTGWPGLCFVRLTRQHTRGSALLGSGKDDAESIAHQIDVRG